MPVYEFQCTHCNHEWDDICKISDPIPERCPSCKKKGKVKKLISWCSGTVILTGKENVIKQWNEGKKIARQAMKNDHLAANLVGEDKFQKTQTAIDKFKK